MQSFDFDYATAILVAVLLMLVRIVPLVFAAARVCVQEYYAFRGWWRTFRERTERP